MKNPQKAWRLALVLSMAVFGSLWLVRDRIAHGQPLPAETNGIANDPAFTHVVALPSVPDEPQRFVITDDHGWDVFEVVPSNPRRPISGDYIVRRIEKEAPVRTGPRRTPSDSDVTPEDNTPPGDTDPNEDQNLRR
jgi:hypothetical protein